MNTPTSRFSKSPLESLSIATLRRMHPWCTDIHRWAVACECRRRNLPIHSGPISNPMTNFSTSHLREIEGSISDPIAAHAARDEINKRGKRNRIDGQHCPSEHVQRRVSPLRMWCLLGVLMKINCGVSLEGEEQASAFNECCEGSHRFEFAAC